MKTYDYIIKKYNISVGRQHIIEIPNMGRENLAELFAELGFERGMELGVDRGEYSEVLCRANPQAQMFGVDPWAISAYELGTYVDMEQEYFNSCYDKTIKRLAPYKNYSIIRKTSADALEDFADNSLDFVYVDANHDFPNFTFDIHNWLKKVRIGGIMSGHDYADFPPKKFNHIKRALQAYARSYRIIPFFVVGAFNYDLTNKPSAMRDKYRSWFWVKDEK